MATSRTLFGEPELPGYQLGALIGSGAAATVLAATRISDQVEVAVKCVSLRGSREVATALREADILANNEHPSIVKLYGVIAEDTSVRLLLERADGGDLATVLRVGGRKSEEHLLLGFVQLALALWHLHKRGIIHRDIKPQNILVHKGLFLKFCDFGTACRFDDWAAARQPAGTPCYLAPELLQGQPYSEKSDVWALGCSLYESIAMRRPYDGPTPFAIMRGILEGNRKSINADCSPELCALVDRMLHPDPKVRPSIRDVLATPFLLQHIQTYASWLEGDNVDTTILCLGELDQASTQSAHSINTIPAASSSPHNSMTSSSCNCTCGTHLTSCSNFPGARSGMMRDFSEPCQCPGWAHCSLHSKRLDGDAVMHELPVELKLLLEPG